MTTIRAIPESGYPQELVDISQYVQRTEVDSLYSASGAS